MMSSQYSVDRKLLLPPLKKARFADPAIPPGRGNMLLVLVRVGESWRIRAITASRLVSIAPTKWRGRCLRQRERVNEDHNWKTKEANNIAPDLLREIRSVSKDLFWHKKIF